MADSSMSGVPSVERCASRSNGAVAISCWKLAAPWRSEEAVDLGFVLAGQQWEPGHTDLQASGGADHPMPQAPLLLGGEQGHAVLDRTRLAGDDHALRAQRDRVPAEGEQAPRAS